MKNSDILLDTIKGWSTPILEKAMQNIANDSVIFAFAKNLISPEWLTKAIMEHLGYPLLKQYIDKIPDEMLPAFTLDLLDGMIDKRVKEGGLELPSIGIKIAPVAFENLRKLCENNFKQYAEKKDE